VADWETIPGQTARHEQEREDLILDALVASDGRQADAARILDVAPGSLWRAIQRRPALAQWIGRHGHGRGAPPKPR